ncbi:MAG: hypothetical protein Q8P18_22620 [Pseudomonadota bacterium]|nr:hypothetical protein [Pseudomonadota bacterium]
MNMLAYIRSLVYLDEVEPRMPTAVTTTREKQHFRESILFLLGQYRLRAQRFAELTEQAERERRGIEAVSEEIKQVYRFLVLNNDDVQDGVASLTPEALNAFLDQCTSNLLASFGKYGDPWPFPTAMPQAPESSPRAGDSVGGELAVGSLVAEPPAVGPLSFLTPIRRAILDAIPIGREVTLADITLAVTGTDTRSERARVRQHVLFLTEKGLVGWLRRGAYTRLDAAASDPETRTTS